MPAAAAQAPLGSEACQRIVTARGDGAWRPGAALEAAGLVDDR